MNKELQQYKEAQMLQLIRETVNDLQVIGDRLESYANEELAAKHLREEKDQRVQREGREDRDARNQGDTGE